MAMEKDQLQALEVLVGKLKKDPSLLEKPELSFFKDYLLSLGAKVGGGDSCCGGHGDGHGHGHGHEDSGHGHGDGHGSETKKEESAAPPVVEEESEEEPEEPEEPEEEDPERLSEDKPPFPAQPPKGEKELSDADMDKQNDLKQVAQDAIEDGDLNKALEKFTEAMQIGNVSAMMFAKRADMLLKLKRPCACIADCDAAIEVNPNSAKAFKIRGKAYRKLGNWEMAHKDLSLAQSIDFDDDIVDLHKLVDEKWKKISERQTRLRIKAEEKEKKRKQKDYERRKKQAQEEYERAKSAPSGAYGGMPGGFPGGMPGGFPGGFPGGMGGPGGMPGMPPGFDPSMLSGLMQDPELMAAFTNPGMMAKMQDIMSNPANLSKYQDDPEVLRLMQKMQSAMGGMGGAPGGMGGMGSSAEADSGPSVEEVDEID